VARNIEIKSRVGDAEAMRRLVEGAAGAAPEILDQTDTFFRVGGGRFKLREVAGAGGELIYYRRADQGGPKESRFERVAVADAPALRALLAAALGVCGEVHKRRLAYRIGRTRIHLDRVAGLGEFLELEVQLAPDEPPAAGIAEAQELMRRFGIGEQTLVPQAYVDLLNGAEGPAAG